MTTADEFMRAVRRGDVEAEARLRAELVAQEYGAPNTREAIRDLWEVFGVPVADKVARYQMAQARQRCAEIAAVLDGRLG